MSDACNQQLAQMAVTMIVVVIIAYYKGKESGRKEASK